MKPLFTIDGQQLPLRVLKLSREFSQLEGRNAMTTLDGQRHFDPVGTAVHYSMTVTGTQDALEQFWQLLCRPVQSHSCTFPYGDTTLTQQMYVDHGSQTLGPDIRWEAITVRFQGAQPMEVDV